MIGAVDAYMGRICYPLTVITLPLCFASFLVKVRRCMPWQVQIHVMLAGKAGMVEPCHPAWSRRTVLRGRAVLAMSQSLL